MKYIKKFEMNENKPEVGDYVICTYIDDSDDSRDYVNKFTSSHVGKIIEILIDIDYPYKVEYSNNNIMIFSDSEILYYSKDKEELELILNTKKFNI